MIKKIIVIGLLAMGMSIPKSEAAGPSLNIKGVEVFIPMAKTNLVYLFDLQNDVSKVGAEFDFVRYKKLTLTVGGVTEFNENGDAVQGAPLIGLDYDVPIGFLEDRLRLGGYVSRDFEDGDTIAGIKSSIKLW